MLAEPSEATLLLRQAPLFKFSAKDNETMTLLSTLLRIILWFFISISLALTLFFTGVGVWQLVDQKAVMDLVVIDEMPVASKLPRFFDALVVKNKSAHGFTADERVQRAAEKITICMNQTTERIATSRDLPSFMIIPQDARHWQQVMTFASEGKSEKYLGSSSDFVCEALKNPKSVDLIDKLGIEQFVVESLHYLQNNPMEGNSNSSDLFSTIQSEITLVLRKIFSNPLIVLTVAAASLLILLVFYLLLRVTALSGSLQSNKKSKRFDLTSKKPKRAEPSLSQRELPKESELEQKGLYVAAAEVKTDVEPKVIELTVANSTEEQRSATASFTFYNADGVEVGIKDSGKFSVPPKGVITVRTAVPENDGTWVKWRSEIMPL